MKKILAVVTLLLLPAAAAAQSDFELIGIVRTTDQNGLADVTVKIVGGDFRTTGASGEFTIPISRSRIGRRITLQATRQGWIVADAGDLSVVVPADPGSDPIRITMKRAGTAPTPKRTTKPSPAKATPRNITPPELAQLHKLMDLAALLEERGLNDESLKKYEAALEAARKGRFQKEEMECLSRMGVLQHLLGAHAPARTSFKSSQSLAVELNSSHHYNWALLNLGDLERTLGNNDLARRHYSDARGLFQKVGDRLGEANVLRGLGHLE
ncbi:MAG: tetratricopeptide repeat protein, partial [Blastocatellia bacterium]